MTYCILYQKKNPLMARFMIMIFGPKIEETYHQTYSCICMTDRRNVFAAFGENVTASFFFFFFLPQVIQSSTSTVKALGCQHPLTLSLDDHSGSLTLSSLPVITHTLSLSPLHSFWWSHSESFSAIIDHHNQDQGLFLSRSPPTKSNKWPVSATRGKKHPTVKRELATRCDADERRRRRREEVRRGWRGKDDKYEMNTIDRNLNRKEITQHPVHENEKEEDNFMQKLFKVYTHEESLRVDQQQKGKNMHVGRSSVTF